MTDIKLTYFNARGRAEIIRLILAYSGQEYEDCRLQWGLLWYILYIFIFIIYTEDMASLRPSLPYGQLPILEYNGEVLCQSITIARFLAKQFGLAGDTSLESALADEVVDSITDIFDVIAQTIRKSRTVSEKV